MKFFPSTIKWELKKWRVRMLPLIIAALILWLALWAMPTPAAEWEGIWYMLFSGFYAMLAAAAALIGLAMAMFYPMVSVAGYEFWPSTLAERLSGRRFAVPLTVRLALAVLTYAIGVAIFIGTVLLLRDIEFAANIFMQIGCECALVAHPPEGIICLRTSARGLAGLAASVMPIFTLAIPLYLLFVAALIFTDGRDKLSTVFSFIPLLWIAGSAVTFFTGHSLPGGDILMFVIYPVGALLLSCRMIDRFADMVGGVFLW